MHCNLWIEFGTAVARRLKTSRATAVFKSNLIRSIEFFTAVVRRLKRALATLMGLVERSRKWNSLSFFLTDRIEILTGYYSKVTYLHHQWNASDCMYSQIPLVTHPSGILFQSLIHMARHLQFAIHNITLDASRLAFDIACLNLTLVTLRRFWLMASPNSWSFCGDTPHCFQKYAVVSEEIKMALETSP